MFFFFPYSRILQLNLEVEAWRILLVAVKSDLTILLSKRQVKILVKKMLGMIAFNNLRREDLPSIKSGHSRKTSRLRINSSQKEKCSLLMSLDFSPGKWQCGFKIVAHAGKQSS